jgi:hypothetical protein
MRPRVLHAHVVSAIGLAGHREVKPIPVGTAPHGMAFLSPTWP